MKLLLSIVAVLALIGCGKNASQYDAAFELDEATFDVETMQMIQKETGLSIPKDARGLRFIYKPPIDPAFLAQIEIPDDSIDSVRTQLEALIENRIRTSGGLRERTSWWRPSEGTVLVNKQMFDSRNGSLLHVILVDEDGRCILYIDKST